jgi:hypothetical protein
MPTRPLLLVACLLLGACAGSGLHNAQPASTMPEPAVTGPSNDPYAVGKRHLRDNNYGLAVESFRVALRADPESVQALNGLAIAYDQLGRFDVSRALYDRALRIDPDSTETLNNLARSLIRQGQSAAALAYLERARAASPDNPTVLANLRAAGGNATGDATAARPVPLAAAPPPPAAAEPRPRIVRTAWRVSSLLTADAGAAEPAGLPLDPRRAYRAPDPPPIAPAPARPVELPEALLAALPRDDDVVTGGHLVRLVAREVEDLPPLPTLELLALSAPEPEGSWVPAGAGAAGRLAALVVVPRPWAVLDPPLPRPWAMLDPPPPRPWTVLDPPPPRPTIVLAQG